MPEGFLMSVVRVSIQFYSMYTLPLMANLPTSKDNLTTRLVLDIDIHTRNSRVCFLLTNVQLFAQRSGKL